MLNGLTNINIELTSRCNKKCWMCGRRERDRLYSDLSYGDIDFTLLELLSKQVPEGIMIQLHNNGESLLYPRFGDAVKLFKSAGCITNIVTNGKLIVEKSDEIINNLDILSISIIENDEEAIDQINIIREFLRIKKDDKPYTTLRFVGNVDRAKYSDFNLLNISRTLHMPQGSIGYKCDPTIPEHGVCWDFLTRLAIDRFGDVSVCVRFDPNKELVLGNIKNETLDELWNGQKRLTMKKMHVEGNRKMIPYCGNKCEFWGIPTSHYVENSI